MVKQILLPDPDGGFGRNLFGLSFLYQDPAAKAVVQYERLLSQPEAPATWFANAGHAYAKIKRWNDSELAFREAVRRAPDRPVGYLIALADVFLEQRLFEKAAKELEQCIQAD